MQTSFDAPRRIPAEDGRSNSGEWSAKWTTKGSLHFLAIQWAYFMHSGEYTKAYTEENFSERFFFNHDNEYLPRHSGIFPVKKERRKRPDG
jgi:hypothetical protein